MKYLVIDGQRKKHSVPWMCRLLHATRSGFYAWQRSRGRAKDETLLTLVKAIHVRSREAYGSPRIHQELRRQGYYVGRNRVQQAMREMGLRGRTRRRYRQTTVADRSKKPAPNLLARNFLAHQRNKKWVTDLTVMRTDEGDLYLAVITDLFSNRVVGDAMADHMRVELALAALEEAVKTRSPEAGLLHHSDQGSQYTSREYQKALEKHGIMCSMSRKGECWDNAVAEAFFGRLKEELYHGRRWRTRDELKKAIREYIDCFYNTRRIQKRLDFLSPVEYELKAAAALEAT